MPYAGASLTRQVHGGPCQWPEKMSANIALENSQGESFSQVEEVQGHGESPAGEGLPGSGPSAGTKVRHSGHLPKDSVIKVNKVIQCFENSKLMKKIHDGQSIRNVKTSSNPPLRCLPASPPSSRRLWASVSPVQDEGLWTRCFRRPRPAPALARTLTSSWLITSCSKLVLKALSL